MLDPLDPQPNRQREAFPKLDIVAAKAAMEHLIAPVCVYTQNRRIVGQLFVPDVQDDNIIVNYLFAIDHLHSSERQSVLKIKPSPSLVDPYRMVFECPQCTERRWNLYYAGTWACAKCHRLLYRSQLVGKDVSLWEARDKLEARLRSGRPKGMHNRTYMTLVQELHHLRNRLQDRPRTYASDEQDQVIRDGWVPAAEIDLWSARYTVRSGSFVEIAA